MLRFNTYNLSDREKLIKLLNSKPYAFAEIKGGIEYPNIKGKIYFNKIDSKTLISAFVSGLPINSQDCAINIFAFHIHQGESCGGNDFEDSLGHYNPNDCPHPAHSGDMPPLFATKDGKAVLLFESDRFMLENIIGKTVIIHSSVDDFTSQPSGNSGEKIACGVIKRY